MPTTNGIGFWMDKRKRVLHLGNTRPMFNSLILELLSINNQTADLLLRALQFDHSVAQLVNIQ